uniref:Tail tubular protein n=1 Tax=viral metagenome TaxID=1070528 RepID=A0A6M3XP30_9ZZZZ
MATAITEISKRVQPDVIGCPKIMVDRAVVDSIIRFCEDTYVLERGFEHDVETADVTAADNDSVTVTLSDYGITEKPLSVTEFRIDGGLWETSYIELLNDLDDLSIIAIQGAKFFNFPSDTNIKFYGIDAQDQTFYIKLSLCPLITMTTIDDFIYRRWRKAIESGARWELMSMPRKDWSDPIGAITNRSAYNDGVADAKISKDKGYTKGNTQVKSMRFF